MSRIDRENQVGELTEEATKGWWLHLLIGVAWIVFAFIVLSFDFETVWAVAVFFGVGFIVGGITELAFATTTKDWRWLRVLFGIAGIVFGTLALVWPGVTFVVLAAIVAWYVLFAGLFEIVAAFALREDSELWWLSLVLGLLQIAVGFWAIGYAGRSIVLLVVWVGAAALARGVSELFFGFALQRTGRELRRRLGART